MPDVAKQYAQPSLFFLHLQADFLFKMLIRAI